MQSKVKLNHGGMPMSEAHTVTGLLSGVCAGDEEAVEKLVHLYLDRLVEFGSRTYRRKFADTPRPAEDEEDAALSALDSFCAAARDGKHQDLANRNHLWNLLTKITIRKIYDQRKKALAEKRGGKNSAQTVPPQALHEVISSLPGPEAEAEWADTYRNAMKVLANPELKRTVYRKLEIIKKDWDVYFAGDR
jgi:hypothetical protein